MGSYYPANYHDEEIPAEAKTMRHQTEKALTRLLLGEIARSTMVMMSYFFREPVTLNYPFEKGPLSPRFRGEHALRRYPNGEVN